MTLATASPHAMRNIYCRVQDLEKLKDVIRIKKRLEGVALIHD